MSKTGGGSIGYPVYRSNIPKEGAPLGVKPLGANDGKGAPPRVKPVEANDGMGTPPEVKPVEANDGKGVGQNMVSFASLAKAGAQS